MLDRLDEASQYYRNVWAGVASIEEGKGFGFPGSILAAALQLTVASYSRRKLVVLLSKVCRVESCSVSRVTAILHGTYVAALCMSVDRRVECFVRLVRIYAPLVIAVLHTQSTRSRETDLIAGADFFGISISNIGKRQHKKSL